MAVLHQIKGLKNARNIFIFSLFSLQLQCVHLYSLLDKSEFEIKGSDGADSVYKDVFEKLSHDSVLTDRNEDHHTAMKTLTENPGNVYQATVADSAGIPDLYLSKFREMLMKSDDSTEVKLRGRRFRRNATLKKTDRAVRNRHGKKLFVLHALRQISQILDFIVNRRDKHQRRHRHLHGRKHRFERKKKAIRKNSAPLFVG